MLLVGFGRNGAMVVAAANVDTAPQGFFYIQVARFHIILLLVCNRLLIIAFGRLELEWCERKILLSVWWLEASAGAM